MSAQPQPEQNEIRLDELQTKITDTWCFIANALCKDVDASSQHLLEEKQSQLHFLLSQKEQLLGQLKNS